MAAIASLPTSIAPLPRSHVRPAPQTRSRPDADPVLVSVPDLVRTPFPVGGRTVAGLVLALVGLLAAVALATMPAVSAAETPAVAGTHVVAEGDSLWSIAVEHAPAGEAAGYVERLVELNDGATVIPGEVVSLPVP